MIMALFSQLQDKNLTDMIINHAGLSSHLTLACVNTDFADYMAKRHTQEFMSMIFECVGSYKITTTKRLFPFLLRHCTEELLNMPRNDGLLQFFIMDGYLDLVQMMVDDGRVHLTDDLFESVGFADFEMMSFLLSIPSIKPSVSLLESACDAGNTAMVQLLLSSPKVEPTGLALLNACQRANLSTIRVLLDDGRVDPDYAIYRVIAAEHLRMIQLFLDRGLVDCEYYLNSIKGMRQDVRDLLKQKRRKK